ncbi:MAG TPA: family 16 glycosylhydrolase [Anaerolineales bacterium]|nr:family 16 glycosylhydrolase [Anaerolineales bacterium]
MSKSHSARVDRLSENSWRLDIPAGSKYRYRLAQLDDHGTHQRSLFHWKPPLSFSLQARVSAEALPGTWGFGLWNDPFNFAISYNLLMPRLPALPDAAWFFYAAPENHLSVYDDLPSNRFLAATFSSKKIPTALLVLSSPIMALTLVPGAAQAVRRLLRRWVKQDAVHVQACQTDWHAYRIEWEPQQVAFFVDDVELKRTNTAPHPPLSLVIWIDNQYAALPPTGRLRYGYSGNPDPAWMEIKDIRLHASD